MERLSERLQQVYDYIGEALDDNAFNLENMKSGECLEASIDINTNLCFAIDILGDIILEVEEKELEE